MAERPILLSGPMVRAILSGTKTQTRRVVKQQPAFEQVYEWRGRTLYDGESRRWFYRGHDLGEVCCNTPLFSKALAPFSPLGAPGDTLWVRETWRADDVDDARTLYAADMPADALAAGRGVVRWRPSIHMPRGRSRLSLRVTSVRVERLHAITEDDARAEGITSLSVQTGPHTLVGRPVATEFGALWRSINGPASWDANPWVWVVGFERAEVSRG